MFNNIEEQLHKITMGGGEQSDSSLEVGEDRIELEAIFQAFSDMLFRMDLDGKILGYKAGKASLLYTSPEQFLGKRIQDVLPDDVGKQCSQALDRVIQTGEVAYVKYKLGLPDGDRWFDARMVKAGKQRIVAIIRDITDHVQNQNRIHTQLDRLAALRAIDAVITSSFDLNLTLSVLLRQVIKHLNVDAADVLLFNPDRRSLERVVGFGFQANKPQKNALPIGQGYAGLAALRRETIRVLDLKNRNELDVIQPSHFSGEDFVSYYAVPLIAKGHVKGVLEIFNRIPLVPDDEWSDLLAMMAGQAAIAIDSADLFRDLQRSHNDLIIAYDATIEGWSRALDLHNQKNEGHTRRVVELTERLARRMGISEEDILHIRRGAMLHDIGKMGVPDRILSKDEPLTDDEWAVMRMHPQYAKEMLSPIAYLRPALAIPYSHHERWDGTGYPQGLKGDEIPLAARIFSVADVYDAMTSERPHRSAWENLDALEYIQSHSGTHFDPEVVKVFLKMIRQEG